MIYTFKNLKRSTLHRLAFILTFATTPILFATNLVAQENKNVKTQHGPQVQSSAKDAPISIMNEYSSILSKYDLTSKKGKKEFNSTITGNDKAKLETLFKKMSKRQQAEQTVGFRPNIAAPPMIVPTNKQLEQWENAKVYEVWIDQQKVANSLLANYSNTDFSAVSVTKQPKDANNNGTSKYKVNLITNEYYQEYYTSSSTNKAKTIMFVKDTK